MNERLREFLENVSIGFLKFLLYSSLITFVWFEIILIIFQTLKIQAWRRFILWYFFITF